jgi:hypothetical protein
MTSLADAFTDSETTDLKILVLFSTFGLMVSAAMASQFSNTELLSYALLNAGCASVIAVRPVPPRSVQPADYLRAIKNRSILR